MGIWNFSDDTKEEMKRDKLVCSVYNAEDEEQKKKFKRR